MVTPQMTWTRHYAPVMRSLSPPPLPDFEPRHLEEMVSTIATQLRLRRAHVRVQAAALEHAEHVKAARTGQPLPGSEDTDVAPDLDDLNGRLHETTQRQRALNREYQIAKGSRPADSDEVAAEPNGESTEPLEVSP